MAEEEMIIDVPSAEEIARHYSACLDSVALITDGKPEGMSDEDLGPINDAIAANGG